MSGEEPACHRQEVGVKGCGESSSRRQEVGGRREEGGRVGGFRGEMPLI